MTGRPGRPAVMRPTHFNLTGTDTCGHIDGGNDPTTGHPCGRTPDHAFDDRFGHVCTCHAERFLERHNTHGSGRTVA